MVPADRNGVPFRHLTRRPREYISHNPQRRTRGIYVGPTRDIFLQDVVLDSPADLPRVRALFPGDQEVERQQNRRRRIDGHRGAHVIQTNAIQQHLHVGQRINGDTHPSHLARRQRVV